MKESDLLEKKVMKSIECCKTGNCGECPLDKTTYDIANCRVNLFDDILSLVESKNGKINKLENIIKDLKENIK